MAHAKYASLPDLDFAADVYETPDLISDHSTIAAPILSENIETDALSPSQARERFIRESLDATETDFSGKLGTTGTYRTGRLTESRREKISRIKRELEELKNSEEKDEDIYHLSDLIAQLQTTTHQKSLASSAPENISEIDLRLAKLEKCLGIDTNNFATPVLSLLSTTSAKLSLLNSSGLDTMIRQIKTLLHELSKELPEQEKLNALYANLETIEKLEGIVPHILDRLRSLKVIHDESANVVDGLRTVELKSEEITEDIAKWKEAVEKLESLMNQIMTDVGGNVSVLNSRIADLEDRISKV
ncbi:putative dynactin subunit 2 [Neolecta irregularis DAH-3]|uniref:Putative dynactin subunit 2 n=1 Tax=Neolecta irregularis (strain DAH-3) TaxID=1198029 RepID=A0A1U7LMG4_NEOID|nr:putative dynactin subunit 2 [Neolecta irregularis DAH-3]|eukprot:OLL23856.1 putative dynactin subunit 2 [Neolecta irregularis DAH-3]